MSDHTGSFSLSQLEDRDSLLLLAAGTGITPILRLLPLIAQTKTTLINFNKTEKVRLLIRFFMIYCMLKKIYDPFLSFLPKQRRH